MSILQALELLGLSSYEAKAFAALMKEHPLTGYQLSRISSVPRSRIYETLEKLSAKGFVLIQPGKPVQYIPITSEELSHTLQQSLSQNLKQIGDWAKTIEKRKSPPKNVWLIEGHKNILSKAAYMIETAQHCVIISGFESDLVELLEPLEHAVGRSVDCIVVYSGKFTSAQIKKTFPKRWDEERRFAHNELLLVVDTQEVLAGNTTGEEYVSALYTNAPEIIFVIREQILHEVVISRLLNYIPPGIYRELMTFYNQSINI